MVDLPEPVRPTIASLPPAGTFTLMSRNAQCAPAVRSACHAVAAEVAERDMIPFDRAGRLQAHAFSFDSDGPASRSKISSSRFIEAFAALVNRDHPSDRYGWPCELRRDTP